MSTGSGVAGPAPEILVKGKRFAIELHRGGPGSQTLGVVISGVIDEESRFESLLQEIERSGRGAVEFHLGNVVRLNSVGVREWLLFIEKLRGKAPFRFTLLSQAIVEYASSMLNLLGDEPHVVHAFHVPYFCEGCQSRVSAVLKTSDMVSPDGTIKAAPLYRCPKCAKSLELDYPEDEYFRFLRGCRAPAG